MKKNPFRQIGTKIFQLVFMVPLAIGLASVSLQAQTVSVIDAFVSMETSATNPALLEGTFVVTLSDTTAITNIQVKLGTDATLTDVMSHTFVFDIQSGLPSGFTYSRIGNRVTLGIGTYTDKSTFYGEARLQSSSGSWSQPFQFITN
ncbi:MAG: hypothetical protein ABI723_26495 [Bacteroidia bacterium]